MIDISTHRLAPGELLARRLAAASTPYRGCADELGDFETPRGMSAGSEIIPVGSEGEPLVLVSGTAGEVRSLAAGRRQILRLRLPGDVLYANEREAVMALGRVRLVVAAPFFERLDQTDAPARLRRAWLALARADQLLMRDHIVRLGRMTAQERVAHLLLETHDRLDHVGLVDRETFHLPTTQEALSDLVGLSVVHLSRTLQILRRGDLISLQNGRIEILDRAGLVALCGWRPVRSDRGAMAPPLAKATADA